MKSQVIKRHLRVHAIPLSDDDGQRAYTFTVDNLAKGIERANQTLRPAGIELVFDPANDWRPRKSTTLNNLTNGGKNWWVEGNKVAARIPGKIVIFFRHGPGKDPSGWGHAYPPNTGQVVPSSVALPTDNVNYVVLPNRRNWNTANNGNFIAHEVGHYLGLFHTHPGWGTSEIYKGDADTAAKAEQRVLEYAAANGGTTAAFDGDRLSDTARDLCRDLYDARGLPHDSSGPDTVTVSGTVGGKSYSLTFTPPRDNVMSYFFWGAPQRLTPTQTKVIHQTLAHKHRRILIEPPCHPDFHNLPFDRWQTCFDYWRHRGLDVHTKSINRVGDKLYVSGSFRPGPPMPSWTLMSSSQYQARFDQYAEDNLRPSRIVATETPFGARYSAVWRPAEGPFVSHHRLTLKQFSDRWHELREDGWLHADMFIYRSGNTHRVAATWVKAPWTNYATYYDMTPAVYQQRFDDFWDKGLRVTTFCAYRVGGGYRYAAIWEELPGRWGHWYGMTAAQYQDKHTELSASGHRLHQIQAYGTRFSGIWSD